LLSSCVVAGSLACTREGPRAAATDSVDPGPTPEEFCAHVDYLSRDDLADATSDEKRAAHAVCVEASTDDRAKFPEWAPCARCMMEVSSMEAYDARCHSTCAALEAKMQAQSPGDASTAD
jgi:hypothetical protein